MSFTMATFHLRDNIREERHEGGQQEIKRRRESAGEPAQTHPVGPRAKAIHYQRPA